MADPGPRRSEQRGARRPVDVRIVDRDVVRRRRGVRRREDDVGATAVTRRSHELTWALIQFATEARSSKQRGHGPSMTFRISTLPEFKKTKEDG